MKIPAALLCGISASLQQAAGYFIGIVKNTFRFRNVFLLQALMPQFFFRNMIMASGIGKGE
jgi:hypothetical protein